MRSRRLAHLQHNPNTGPDRCCDILAGPSDGALEPNLSHAGRQPNLNIVDSARLFAMENLAAADALIGCWNDKYYYQFWRPIAAIREADTDGNPEPRPTQHGCHCLTQRHRSATCRRWLRRPSPTTPRDTAAQLARLCIRSRTSSVPTGSLSAPSATNPVQRGASTGSRMRSKRSSTPECGLASTSAQPTRRERARQEGRPLPQEALLRAGPMSPMTNVRNQPSRFTVWRLFVLLEVVKRDGPLRDFVVVFWRAIFVSKTGLVVYPRILSTNAVMARSERTPRPASSSVSAIWRASLRSRVLRLRFHC